MQTSVEGGKKWLRRGHNMEQRQQSNIIIGLITLKKVMGLLRNAHDQ